MSEPSHKVKSFQDLLQLVTQDEQGMHKHLYSKLQTGDVWWIPDLVTKFGNRDKHPWVVVSGYKPNRPPVIASPRTTKFKSGMRLGELFTPGGILPDLTKDGVILVKLRRSFSAEKFREFEYIGRLSDDWINELKKSIKMYFGGQ